MKAKVNKTVSERAVEAQAKQDKLCLELGVTPTELKIISDFRDIVADRLDQAPTEPFISGADEHIRKRMGNNEEAVAALQLDLIEHNAQSWVEANSIGRAIGGLTYPAPLDKAKVSVVQASRRLTANPDDPAIEVSYAKAVRWLAQMQCQAEFKEALTPIFQALYRLQTGAIYSAPDQTVKATTEDESLSVLMG